MKQRIEKSAVPPAAAQRKPFFALENGAQSGPRVQRKLTVGAAGDQFEQQADAIADQVVRRFAQDTPQVQTQCAACKTGGERLQRQAVEEEEEVEEEWLQAKSAAAHTGNADGAATVDPQLEQGVRHSLGGGGALPSPALERMNDAFGVDFSAVRLHTGPEAVQLNRDLGARAFTYGRDVFLGQPGYDPQSAADNHLLAHELTHVVQQGGVPAATVQNKGLADTLLRQTDTPDLQLLRVDYPATGDGHVQHSSYINNTYYVDWDAWIEDDVLLFEFTYNGSDNASVTVSLFDTEGNGYLGGGVVRWGPESPATQYIEFTEFPPTVSGEVRDAVTTRTELVNESRERSGISAYKKIFRGR